LSTAIFEVVARERLGHVAERPSVQRERRHGRIVIAAHHEHRGSVGLVTELAGQRETGLS
jgi:hypothetical protein